MQDELFELTNMNSIHFIVRRIFHTNKPYIEVLFHVHPISKVPKNIKMSTKHDCIKYCYFYLNTFVFDMENIEYVPFSLVKVEKERSVYFLLDVKLKEEVKFYKKGFEFCLVREIKDFHILHTFQSFFFLCDDNGEILETPFLLSHEPAEDNYDLDCLPISRCNDGFFHFSRFTEKEDTYKEKEKDKRDQYIVFLGKYGFNPLKKDSYDSLLTKTAILVRERNQFVKNHK